MPAWKPPTRGSRRGAAMFSLHITAYEHWLVTPGPPLTACAHAATGWESRDREAEAWGEGDAVHAREPAEAKRAAAEGVPSVSFPRSKLSGAEGLRVRAFP